MLSGKCKLCNQEKTLVNSHIIPKALYSTKENLKLISNTTRYPKRSPQGIYDQFLCSECEEVFKKLDDYGIKVFSNGIKVDKHIGDKRIELIKKVNNKNIDIEKIKLFFLSLLWRADSCDDESFQEVDLVNKHSTVLKEILLNTKNLAKGDYSVICLKYEKDKKGYEKFYINPRKTSIEGVVFYRFYLGNIGYHFYIKVDSQALPEVFKEMSIGCSADIVVSYAEDKDKFVKTVQKILKECPLKQGLRK